MHISTFKFVNIVISLSLCAFLVCTMHAQQVTTAVNVVIGSKIVVGDVSGTSTKSAKWSVANSTGLAPAGASNYAGPDFYYGAGLNGSDSQYGPQLDGLYQYNKYGIQAQTGSYTDEIATYFYTQTIDANSGDVYTLNGSGMSFDAYITGGDNCTFEARFMVLNKGSDGTTSYYLSSTVKTLETSGIDKNSHLFQLDPASIDWYVYSAGLNSSSFFLNSTPNQVAASTLNNIVGVGVYFEDTNTNDQGYEINTKQMILNALQVDMMSIAVPELHSFSLISGLLVFVVIIFRRRSFLLH